jgi:hypothetical protein
VESAQYQAPRPQEFTPPVFVANLPAGDCSLVAESLPKAPSLGILTAGPPELSAGWQFLCRAASSPRAPTFAS